MCSILVYVLILILIVALNRIYSLVEPLLSLPAELFQLQRSDCHLIVNPGGPVVIILSTGSEVRGFNPGWGR